MKYLAQFDIVEKTTGIVVKDYKTVVELRSVRPSEYRAIHLSELKAENLTRRVSRCYLLKKYSITAMQLQSMMKDRIINPEFNLYMVKFRKLEYLGL